MDDLNDEYTLDAYVDGKLIFLAKLLKELGSGPNIWIFLDN